MHAYKLLLIQAVCWGSQPRISHKYVCGICIHAYIHIPVCVCTYTLKNMHMYKLHHIHINFFACTPRYIHTQKHACIQATSHTHIKTCMYITFHKHANMHAYKLGFTTSDLYIYIYIYIYMYVYKTIHVYNFQAFFIKCTVYTYIC
jgi:hypothetical protein